MRLGNPFGKTFKAGDLRYVDTNKDELFYFVFSPETADINKPVEIALVKNKQ